MESGGAGSDRIESLDSIRGLAALAVLLGHSATLFAWTPDVSGWVRWPVISSMFDGRSAVAMFFVLSGFVLSRPFIGASPKELFVPTFYLRRVTRIWIPWFFAFCLSIVMQSFFFHPFDTDPPLSAQGAAFWSHAAISVSTFFKQCFFLLHDRAQQLIPQDWSLGLELKGSAFVPVFIFLLRRHLLFLLAFGAAFLVFIPTGAYYLSFILGVLVANYWDRGESILRRLPLSAKCGVLATGFLLYQTQMLSSWAGYELPDKIVWSVCSVGCVLIIMSSLASRRIESLLNHRVLTFLGRISYSVYLLQAIVLLCFLPLALYGLNAAGLTNRGVLFAAMLCIPVFVTVAAAALSYRFVERPCIRLGHWASSRIKAGASSRIPVQPASIKNSHPGTFS